MDMPKLLIADPSDEFRRSLSEALCGIGTVRTCATGAQALELLSSFRPDILVMDLTLPELDGISLLHRAADAGLSPAVLATTWFISTYVSAAMSRLGVNYVLQKPCSINALVSHIGDMAAELKPTAITREDLHSAGSNLLLRLGFVPKLDGFAYLQAALPIYMEDSTQAITKELYAAVGKLYNKDGRQVERSIRNAIGIAYNKRDDALWREFFPCPPHVTLPKPTNGNFIARLATYLAFRLEGYRSA